MIMGRHHLKTNWKLFSFAIDETRRNRKRRDTDKVCGNRKNIGKIRLEWVATFLSYFKRRGGGCGRHNDINILKSIFKIFSYFCSQTPSLVVIRVIVSRGKNICT